MKGGVLVARKQCQGCGNAQAVRPGGLCNRCYSREPARESQEVGVEVVKLDIGKVRTDGETQPRCGLNMEVVAEYRDAHNAGATFPPVEVCFDGSDYWLWEGFHRTFALREAGATEIAAKVRPGTKRDALLLSVGANATHGLRRTTEDKERAVKVVLADPEWGQRSSAWIAEQCKVGWQFVDKARKSLGATPKTVIGRNGVVSPSRLKPESEPQPVEQSSGAETEKPQEDAVRDRKGRAVPESLVGVFSGTSPFRSLVQRLGEMQAEIESLTKTPLGAAIHMATVKIDCRNLQSNVRFSAPFVLCPRCDGVKCSACKKCSGRGWLPERDWESLESCDKAKCEGR